MGAWAEATAADGRKYYYHTGTRETRWEKPEDFDQATTPAATSAASPDPTAVAAAWKETATAEGKIYYYNAITKATSWEAPPGYQPQQANARPAAPAFVAGGMQRHDDDSYRPRERRRDDRDHGLPQRSGFESGRGGGTPWDQRQESAGFRGPMPVKTDEPEYATPELAEEAFFKMLRKHSISADATWEEALRSVIQEKDYRAIKDPRERKQAFDKFCVEVRAQEKEKEKERRQKLREDFRKMLSTHDDIKHYTRWKTARPIIEREAVFRSASDEDDRRQMFDEYMLELKKKHAENEIATQQSALHDLQGLLQALIDNPDTKWNDARESITNNDHFVRDPKFRTLGNVDIIRAFQNHITVLDNIKNENKQREKRLRTRRERQARDGFRELLSQMQNQGKIRAGTKWQDFYPLIADDKRYTNLIGTPGSSALDLFWDIVEEEEQKLRSARNVALDVLEDNRFEINSHTPVADFATVMRSDSRTQHLRDYEIEFVLDKIKEKIRRRAEDDRMYSERHQRKATDALRSLIKHLDPPVRIGDSYEEVVPRLQGHDEFKALDDDEARRSAFEKHIRRLKEKEEDLERERTRRDRDRDRDHRNGSRREAERERDRDRDRDRGHRRTPEVDPYEADRRKAQADRERQYRKASFGLTPPPRDRRDDRGDGHRRQDRGESMSMYDRERREREIERERSYISRADPRDKGRSLDYGDEDVGSRPGSVRKRRDSDGSGGGRREVKVSSPRIERRMWTDIAYSELAADVLALPKRRKQLLKRNHPPCKAVARRARSRKSREISQTTHS